MNYKFCFIFFAIIFLLQLHANAQSISNLSNIRVEELTDEQIKKLVIETDRSGIKDEQLEELATQSGLNQVEIVKLKERMQLARKAMNASATPSVLTIRSQDSISAIAQKPVQDFRNVLNGLQANNFGFEIFANPRITFEPNLRLPTPKNYQLAADDELIIDVSGYSEANYHLKVSPEGIIRIPVAGPVNVNGLTIEQATNLIVKKLSSMSLK
ncbi:MAG: polysaccharide biosynthesis/export family protein [Sphingobacteriales bacterium]|nr:polysaccharide biosynthesis/export family protein [Sphingobacteriales bacterium]